MVRFAYDHEHPDDRPEPRAAGRGHPRLVTEMSLEKVAVERLRQRATRLIFAGAALGTTGLFAAFTLGPLVAVRITGSDASAGLPGAAAVSGVAVGALALSAVMARRGRRPGLAAGYASGVAGAVLTIAALEVASFAMVLVGMLLIGVAHASNQLARFAAADMHVPQRRSVVLGWIVWAGTIGAILGPGSLEPSRVVASAMGVDPLAGGFIVGAVLFAAALVSSVMLRPDPRALADEDTTAASVERTRILPMMRLPHARIAMIVAVAAQVTMLAVMTMTPLHIRHAGAGLASVGLVMSAHFIGMFGLAPVAGTVIARVGAIAAMLAGATLLVAASVLTALIPAHAAMALSAPLLILGVGWSLCFVAASALLSRGLSYTERARLQGSVDAVVWSASAVASVGSGGVVAAFGFPALCLVAATASLLAIGFIWAQRGSAQLASA